MSPVQEPSGVRVFHPFTGAPYRAPHLDKVLQKRWGQETYLLHYFCTSLLCAALPVVTATGLTREYCIPQLQAGDPPCWHSALGSILSASPLLLLRASWQQAKLSVTEVVECYGNKAVMVKNLVTLSGVVLGPEGSADPAQCQFKAGPGRS